MFLCLRLPLMCSSAHAALYDLSWCIGLVMEVTQNCVGQTKQRAVHTTLIGVMTLGVVAL